MKRAFIFSLCLIFVGCFIGKAQNPLNGTSASLSSQIEVYYFHFNVRCETCRAVEAEAKADVESLYSGMVSFKAINLDDAASKAISDKLRISGQTLLIVKRDKQINLTNEGFLYARTNPDKLKSIIKQKVDSFLVHN